MQEKCQAPGVTVDLARELPADDVEAVQAYLEQALSRHVTEPVPLDTVWAAVFLLLGVTQFIVVGVVAISVPMLVGDYLSDRPESTFSLGASVKSTRYSGVATHFDDAQLLVEQKPEFVALAGYRDPNSDRFQRDDRVVTFPE